MEEKITIHENRIIEKSWDILIDHLKNEEKRINTWRYCITKHNVFINNDSIDFLISYHEVMFAVETRRVVTKKIRVYFNKQLVKILNVKC